MKRNFTELKRLARETLTGHFGTPMAGLVIISVLSNCLLLPFDMTLNSSTSQTVIFYIASFFISLLMILFSTGLTYLHINMRRNKPYAIKDIFYFFTHHPDRYILAYLLYIGISFAVYIPAAIVFAVAAFYDLLAVYIVAAIAGILLIIAASIFLYRYVLVFYILIDHPDMKITDSFKESHRMMKKHRMQFFLLQLSFLGWFFLGVFSFFIGFLWIEPYYQQTVISFYFELTGDTDRMEDAKAKQSDPSNSGQHFQAYC